MSKNIHKIFIGISFFVPLVIYFITMAPTASFWDCGEYIATSRILGVPHPPGSPLYLLLGNVFSNLPFLNDIGARVNLISPIASAFSIMFLYLIIVYLIEEYRGKTKTISDMLITYGSALIGALTFAVTDSHWFNAVEAEVYSVSTFFTAIVAWMILKWARNADDWNLRYLLIIVYMFGLAIGVHLLNLLTLPFVALIIYFKKFKFNILSFLLTIFITLITFLIIYVGIIKGIPDITNKIGNLSFIILLSLFLVSTVAINNVSSINKNISKIFSITSIFLLILLVYNALFINNTRELVDNKYNDLIDLRFKMDSIVEELETIPQNELSPNNKKYKTLAMQYDNFKNSFNEKLIPYENILNKIDDLNKCECISGKYSGMSINSSTLNEDDALLRITNDCDFKYSQDFKKFGEVEHINKNQYQFILSDSSIFAQINFDNDGNLNIENDNFNANLSIVKSNQNINSISFIKLLGLQESSTLFIGFLIFSFILMLYFYFSNTKHELTHSFLNFVFTSIVLVFIGYSTYSMIFIRSTQGPNINENSPDTINRALAYMNRDQYGDWSILDRGATIKRSENTNWKRYTFDKHNPTFRDKISFFINYQVEEMYLRYFAWQFIGRGERENYPWHIKDLNGESINNQKPLDGINPFRYGLPLAFIIGLLGMFFHFYKDWKRALAILSFFLATGLMIVIYLNQYDPQPRERDYSFVASFFAFSVWIGIGLSCVLSKIRSFFEDYNIASFISVSCLLFALIFMPIKIFATDYFQHNRKGNFVAWDYGYNLLNSCEPNGIIFTNGDNDTFPLWYLQEVEEIRKDVKVVNLSLLNTPWYINQLINQYPKLELNISKKYLNQKISDKGEIIQNCKPDIYNLTYLTGSEMIKDLCNGKPNKKGKIDCNLDTNAGVLSFDYKSSYPNSQMMPLQDTMILQIIKDIGDTRPIYFATTVSPRNQIGLEEYLQMEGMTYRVLFNKKTKEINYNKMKQNLIADYPYKINTDSDNNIIKNISDYNNAIESGVGIYRYTNLNNSNIYYNDNIKRLVQNYRFGIIHLIQDNISEKNTINLEEIESLLEAMNVFFPEEHLPLEPAQELLLLETVYSPIGDNLKVEKIINKLVDNELFNDNINLEIKIEILRILSLIKGDDTLFVKLIDQFFNTYYLESYHTKYLASHLYENLPKESFLSLYDGIFYTHLSLESEMILLHLMSTEKNTDLIKKGVFRLFNKFYNTQQFNFETQQYIGDYISEELSVDEFSNVCKNIFDNYKSVGMLYALTLTLEENNKSTNHILEIIDEWLEVKNSQDLASNKLKILKTHILQSKQGFQ